MIKYYSNNSIYSILLVVFFFISCKVKKLKNILILIICLQITIPFIVEGCLRFPVLVSHFFHHNKDGKSNFIHFLSQHYSEKHHDENHDEHENLPFHNYSNSFNQTLAINIEIIEFKFARNFIFKEPNKIAFKQNFFQSNVSINIWKPPKIT